jgi:hypothetical protein
VSRIFQDRFGKIRETLNATVDDKESSSGLMQSAEKYGKSLFN